MVVSINLIGQIHVVGRDEREAWMENKVESL